MLLLMSSCGTQAGQKRGQDDRPIPFGPVAAALLVGVVGCRDQFTDNVVVQCFR
jgi:hypothetical protein